MAFTQSNLADGLRNAMNADKPCFISGNVFESSAVEWHLWDGSTYAENLVSAQSGMPLSRAADGFAHSGTATDRDLSNKAHSVVMELTSSGEFDCLFAVYDAGTTATAGNISVTIDIADNDIFTTNQVVMSNETVASTAGTQRFVDLNIGTIDGSGNGSSYTGTGYAKITFSPTDASVFSSGTEPILYEMVLGKRYQLSKKANRPWDPERMQNSVARHVAESGVMSSYVRRAGGWGADLEWQFDTTGGLYSIDDVDIVRNFWNDTNYGTESFVYIEDPSTGLEYARLCQTFDQQLSMPFVGPNERRWAFSMHELPFFATWSP